MIPALRVRMEQTWGGFTDGGAPDRGQRIGARARPGGAHPRPDLARRSSAVASASRRRASRGSASRSSTAAGSSRRRRRVQGATGRPAKPLDVQVDSRRFVGVKLTGDAGLRRDHRPAGGCARPGVSAARLAHDVDAGRRCGGRPSSTGSATATGRTALGARRQHRRQRRRPAHRHARAVPRLARRGARRAARRASSACPSPWRTTSRRSPTAEQWFGAVRGRPAFAVVTIGAGVGYGLVVHDRVITTPDSGLGLGGHLPLDPNGPLCGDGHRGCSTAMLVHPEHHRPARHRARP